MKIYCRHMFRLKYFDCIHFFLYKIILSNNTILYMKICVPLYFSRKGWNIVSEREREGWGRRRQTAINRRRTQRTVILPITSVVIPYSWPYVLSSLRSTQPEASVQPQTPIGHSLTVTPVTDSIWRRYPGIYNFITPIFFRLLKHVSCSRLFTLVEHLVLEIPSWRLCQRPICNKYISPLNNSSACIELDLVGITQQEIKCARHHGLTCTSEMYASYEWLLINIFLRTRH